MLSELKKYLETIEMKISSKKAKAMFIKKEGDQDNVKINIATVEKVQSFQYLGSIVSQDSFPDETIRDSVTKAWNVITKIRPVPRSHNIGIKAKAKLIETTVIPALIYGLETIVLWQEDVTKLKTMLNTVRWMIWGINYKKQANSRWVNREH